MTNYIRDINRFNMSDPPNWWLLMLKDFDDKLVIVPSRQHPVYILARKATLGAAHPKLKTMDDISADSNTKMLARNGLVYVTVLEPVGLGPISCVNWTTAIFNELRRRDLWAHGGAKKFIKTLEEAEADEERKQREAMIAEADYRARDAWNSLQWRTGQRVLTSGENMRPSNKPSGRTRTVGHKAPAKVVLTDAV